MSHVLSNAAYTFPGAQCTPEKYAYVFPEGEESKDPQGRYNIFLCNFYMEMGDRGLAGLAEQVEIQLHVTEQMVVPGVRPVAAGV